VKTIALINAAAGVKGDADRLAAAREALASAGVAADVRGVPGKDLEPAARQALREGADLVIVGGGDGSVSAVAGVVAGTRCVLGVLPMGTLNHFARDLRLPTRLPDAARVIARGIALGIAPGEAGAAPIDLGEVDGRRFINNASIGLYAHIVSKRERQRERLGRNKWVALLVAVASVFRRYPMLRVVLDTGDRALPRNTPFVFVGNNRYEMYLLSPVGRERLDRGELCIYFAHRTGRFGMLRLVLRALVGRLDQARDFETMCLPAVTIETAKKTLHIALDGEVTRLTPPLHFKVLPGVLRVIAPTQGDEMTNDPAQGRMTHAMTKPTKPQ
jgi:diacylglycerol kinase family enzyme